MAKKKTSPDMVRITLSTRTLEDLDLNGKGLGTYRGELKNLDADLSAFERVLQSATNSFEFFNSNLKTIDTKTGLAEQSFFISQDEFMNAYKALKSKSAELSSKRGSGAFAIDVHAVENLQTTRTVYGKRAQKKAMEEIDRLGGTAVVNASNSDKLDITLPYDKSALAGMTKRQRNALISKAIPEAMKLSRIEKKERKKAEAVAEAEAQKRQKKEEQREADKEKAREKASARKTLSTVKKVLAVLTIIGDLVRRILTASVKQASENNKMAVEAHAVGVTATARRGYDIFDVAHGLGKGATFKAIQSVQGMFGDVTSLDEKSLATLARVMGSEVSDLVRSGMGGKNPDRLLDKILDKYFKQFLSGKNSLGQTVGMEQARRELITSLQSVSPEIANLFARMADDYLSGVYGKFEDSKGWRATTDINRTKLSDAEQKFSTEIGKKVDAIKAVLEDLKTAYFTRMCIALDGLLTNVKNIRVGQTAKGKIEEDKINKQKSEESKAVMQKQLALYNMNAQSAIDDLSSIEATPIKSKLYTKAQAKKFKYTVEELAGIQAGIYDAKYFKDTYGKEARAYVARGKDIADNAMFSPEVQDELSRSVVILKQIQAIDKGTDYEIGSGKIADLSMSEAEQTVKAQQYAEQYTKSIVGRSGGLPSQGSEFKRAYLESYYSYLLSNPEVYENEKYMSENSYNANEFKKTYEANLKRTAKEKRIKNISELSYEDKVRAFAETNVNWEYALFSGSEVSDRRKKVINTFALANTADKARENLNTADSTVLAQLARLDAVFSPNTKYNVSSSRGQSGELVIKVQAVDSNGRLGESRTFSVSDTKGYEGNVGTLVTNSKGKITWKTTN